MANLTDAVLAHVNDNNGCDSLNLARLLNQDHQKIIGVIKSLQSLDNVIAVQQLSEKKWQLTQEGKEVAQKGSYEALVYDAISKDGTPQKKLMTDVPNAKIGFSKAMQAGWIYVDKTGAGTPTVYKKVDKIDDKVQQCLKEFEKLGINSLTDSLKTDYKRRKFITETTVNSFYVTKGPNFSLKTTKLETDLTADMIASGSWRDKQFKPYNFVSLGIMPPSGHLHPLMKVRSEFRQIFLEMGYTEMPTNRYVESSFWNFDALFQPQQHPARDAHDTFFISDPATAVSFPMDYLERVKKVHSEGGYGSLGYQCEWKQEEAAKNLLRTHTTAVSTRVLYELAQQKEFKPAKYFSIDRVYRNETLDATHLAEFQQIEGLIADYNLSLGDLMGTIQQFYHKLGIMDIRFKPTYNPYTEPSMEIFSYHKGLKKWVELGNSGVFRPEMLLPMGLPEDVSVIAWGLGLERPTMIKYGLSNIRDLVGPKVDLQMVYDNGLCRLDKPTDHT